MRLIAAAGVALFFWLGLVGTSTGADLVEVTPSGFLQSDLSNMASPPNDGRIFLVERGNGETGRASIRILENGEAVTTPFLTIDNVDTWGERGLMSMAFPPNYAESGLFYVFWIAAGPDRLDPTGEAGDIRIVEFKRSATDPNRADPSSARLVLETWHSASNHNGGWMDFGPDGDLYFSIGDNADGSNAQDPTNLFGKVMRIDPTDPDGTGPARYTIPADNPAFGGSGARREIYTMGLRNPYRGSFAPDGRITIGDVGDGTWEEIDAGDLKGKNLGWPICEGFCSPSNPAYTDPVFAFNHSGSDGYGAGCAVVGGHVVEDESLTGLYGRYIYADFCGGIIQSIDLDIPGGAFQSTGLTGYGNPIAFGKDARGCSYMLQSNAAFRIVGDDSEAAACPRPLPPPPVPEITYNSYIPRRAVLSARLVVGAKCSINCTATATARIRVSRSRHRRNPVVIKLNPVSRQLTANVRGNLTFRIPAGRVQMIRKAIRSGSLVLAPVVIRQVGEDSSGGSGASSVRLVLPRR